MATLRKRGWVVARVEQRIPHSFITRDAFGFGDLLAAHPEHGIALVQVTTMSNLAARESKARATSELAVWLASRGRFLLHGWGKRGGRGKRKVWNLTQRELIHGNAVLEGHYVIERVARLVHAGEPQAKTEVRSQD